MDVTTTLFIGDLSVYCTEQDIFDIFRPFGQVQAVQLKRKASPDTRPSYGFVTFQQREAAEHALLAMNGRIVHGRAIRLGWAEPPKVNINVSLRKHEPPLSAPSAATWEMIESGKVDTAHIHFSYVTNKVDPLREDVFRNIFQHFGEVKDISIKKSQYHPDKGVQTGYGFIHYPLTEEGIASALEAMRSIHGLVVDSVKYSCRLSHALEQYLKNQGRLEVVLGAAALSRTPGPAKYLPGSNSSSFERQSPRQVSSIEQTSRQTLVSPRFVEPHYYPPQQFSTYNTPTSAVVHNSYTQPPIMSAPSTYEIIPPAASHYSFPVPPKVDVIGMPGSTYASKPTNVYQPRHPYHEQQRQAQLDDAYMRSSNIEYYEEGKEDFFRF